MATRTKSMSHTHATRGASRAAKRRSATATGKGRSMKTKRTTKGKRHATVRAQGPAKRSTKGTGRRTGKGTVKGASKGTVRGSSTGTVQKGPRKILRTSLTRSVTSAGCRLERTRKVFDVHALAARPEPKARVVKATSVLRVFGEGRCYACRSPRVYLRKGKAVIFSQYGTHFHACVPCAADLPGSRVQA